MQRIYVDFNARHVDQDVQDILVCNGLINEIGADYLVEGNRVKIYDEETECEAVLKLSKDFPWISNSVWVAQIIPDTIINGLNK